MNLQRNNAGARAQRFGLAAAAFAIISSAIAPLPASADGIHRNRATIAKRVAPDPAALRTPTPNPDLLGAGPPATKQAASDVPISTAPKRASFPFQANLVVNDAPVGEIAAEAAPDGEIWIKAADLADLLGAAISPARTQSLIGLADSDGRVTVNRLGEIGLKARYDREKVAIVINTPIEDSPIRSVRANGREERGPSSTLKPARVAAAANFGLVQSVSDGQRAPYYVNVDGFASIGGGSGATLVYAGAWSPETKGPAWRRDQIQLLHDDYERAIRYAAGDVTPRTYGFQSGRRIIGLSIARAYQEIRPFENLTTAGQARFALERDAVVTIESNGAPMMMQLQRGVYDLRDLAVAAGASRVRITAEDYSGQRTVTDISMWNDPSLLRQGATDFAATIGRVSKERGAEAGLAYSGFVRRGLTKRLTAAVGMEGRDSDWMGQADATFGLGGAAFQLTAATSEADGKRGYAATGAVRTGADLDQRSRVSAYASTTYTDRSFQTPFNGAQRGVRGWDATAGATYSRNGMSYSAGWTRTMSSAGANEWLSADAYYTRGRVSLGGGVSAIDAPNRSRTVEGRVALTLRGLAGKSPYAVTATNKDLSARINYARGVGAGAWSASAETRATRDSFSANGSGTLEANRFRAAVSHTNTWAEGKSSSSSTAALASSIVFADGVFAIGRPVGRAFLLAKRHPSLKSATSVIRYGSGGSSVESPDGKEPYRARSGLLGPPVIALSPYIDERVDVGADNLPLGYDLGAFNPIIVPGMGQGYVVQVGRDDWRSAMGILRGAAGPVASTRLSVERQDAVAPARSAFTNGSGRFYVDGLRPGRYSIMISGRTVAMFEIAETAAAMTNVGELHALGY